MSQTDEPTIGECVFCHCTKLLTHEVTLTLHVDDDEFSATGDACDDCVPRAIEEFVDLQHAGTFR